MDKVSAKSSFDCRDRDGNEFVAFVQIGVPFEQEDGHGRVHAACPFSLDPLFPEVSIAGEDTFHAICLGIELIQKALRAFTIHGGMVYFRGTRPPIDLNSPSILPIDEPIFAKFLSSPDDPSAARTSWPNGQPRRLD